MTPIWFSISCLWKEVKVGDRDVWHGLGGVGQSALQASFGGDRPVCGRKVEGGGILANMGEFKGV